MSNYKNLKKYISEMRMSHIYKPIMLIELIKGNGKASGRKIAKSFLNYDETQIDYYQEIVKKMPFNYISKSLKELKREKENYYIEAFNLTEEEKKELIVLCNIRLDEYINKRGIKNILSHRSKSLGVISGSIKYEVLKRAKNRCELCGIESSKKALEVDHIHPRSRGGKDELSNYQALCYSCNASKGNKDNKDFRDILASYNNRREDCIFCDMSKQRIILENKLAVTIKDNYPITKDHCLVIPKRHIETYFDLYQPELNACNQLLTETKKILMKKDKSIEGFNIGINSGEVAGQTIFHCHIHLIPRRRGDVKDPRGGLRGIFKDKQSY